MEIQTKSCKKCGFSPVGENKYCPMCGTLLEETKSRLESIKHILTTRLRTTRLSIFLLGFIIGSIIIVSAVYLPQYAEDWNRRGEDALNENKFEEAAEYYNKALKLNPSSEEALNGLGDVYFNLIRSQQGHYDLPLDYYKKANKCSKNGNSTYSLNRMGTIFLQNREFKDAQDVFQIILDQDKIEPLELAGAWYYKGMALEELNDSKEAIKCFNNSINVSAGEINSRPLHQNALIAIADIFLNENNSKKAEPYYVKTLDIGIDCENCETACHRLINILKNQGRNEEANAYENKCFPRLKRLNEFN